MLICRINARSLASIGGRPPKDRDFQRQYANVHPHALRHACGHVLAVKGKETRLLGEWLGHRNLNNTALYTYGVSARFRGMWD